MSKQSKVRIAQYIIQQARRESSFPLEQDEMMAKFVPTMYVEEYKVDCTERVSLPNTLAVKEIGYWEAKMVRNQGAA